MLQIVIPMAGEGTRFAEQGYTLPKPFIDVLGKPMIQWVVENLHSSSEARFIFIARTEHLEAAGGEAILQEIAPGAGIVTLDELTEGAACTVLLADKELQENEPLLIANSDQIVDIDSSLFVEDAMSRSLDGSILTFPASETKWSYAELDADGFVVRTAEKDPISSHATVGCYYFKEAKWFLDGAKAMIDKDLRVNGEFYVCPVYNEIVASGGRVGVFEIEADAMHGLGTPEDLSDFIRLHQGSEG